MSKARRAASRIAPILVAAALTAAKSSAQLGLVGRSVTPVGASAHEPGVQADFRNLASGIKLEPALRVQAKSGRCESQVEAKILSPTRAFVEVRGRAAGIRTHQYGASHGYQTTPQGAQRVAFAFRFTAARPVSGTLRVRMTPRMARFWGYESYAVADARVPGFPRVASNGSWLAAITKEFAVTVGPRGLDVEIGALARGKSLNLEIRYGMRVDIEFVPGPGFTSFGRSCGYLWSEGSGAQRSLVFQMGLHRAATLVVVGARSSDVLLPPSIYGCRLLVQPIVVVPASPANGVGLARLPITLPQASIEALVQGIGVDLASDRLHSTNALRLRLP